MIDFVYYDIIIKTVKGLVYMKKFISICLALTLLLSAFCFTASAKDEYTEKELNNLTDASELLGDEDDPEDMIQNNDDDDDDGDDIPDELPDNAVQVTVSILDVTPNHIVYMIDQDYITGDEVKDTFVTINGVKYQSSYISSYDAADGVVDEGVIAEAEFSANIGDIVTTHFIMIDDTDIDEKAEVEEGEDEVLIDICDVNHAIFYYVSDTDPLKSAELTVGGRKVSFTKCNSEKYNDEYDIDSFEYGYVYQAKYKTTCNAIVTATVKTQKGYTYTHTAKAVDTKPKISLDPFTAGDTVLSGSTRAESTVTIKAGGKTFKTKADKKGKFSKKIIAVKTNGKVMVSVKTTTNSTASKTLTVKKTVGKATISGKISKSGKKLTVKLSNAKVGDIVKVTVGNKKYSAKVKKAAASTSVSVKIKGQKKGDKISVVYTDKFKTVKASVKGKVN